MKNFDYLENIPNIAATVCDREGIVLYQNKKAIERDGDVLGKNLYGCHSARSAEMIRRMMERGACHTYQYKQNSRSHFIHQTPWFDAEGKLGGLMELEIDIPENMPVYDRDANSM